MEIITRLVKRFCTAAAAITFIFVLSMQALAISLDGIVSHDEVHSANVQMQCENKNGGNGICTLVTYYTKTESGSLYVAMSGDISYAELTDESPIVYEIYIDGNDPIKIDITGKAEYDEQLFSVKSRAKFEGDGMTCEALIDRKYSFGADPEIFVRVTDDSGIPSKMFEIDTYIAPPETTAEQSTKSESTNSGTTKPNITKPNTAKPNSTKPDSRDDSTKAGKKSSSDKSSAEKESTTKKKKKGSRSKTSSKSKAKTTKAKSKATKTRYKTTKSKSKTTNAGTSNSEQFASARELANDSVINYDGEIETYTLPNGGSTRNAARVKQGVTAVGITVIVATMVSISLLMFKKSGKK